MKSIDFYIQKICDKYIGQQRTNVYEFNEDGVILIQKSGVKLNGEELEKERKSFKEHIEKLMNKIKYCKEQGINIPLYIDCEYDGENYWLLEELAPGQELAYLVDNDDITKIFGNIPYEHIKKYIQDVYLLGINGIGIDAMRRNIFYDTNEGFTTIDVSLAKESKKEDSLYNVSEFFKIFSNVFLVPFSKDEYGQEVKEKTILNVIKAFESGHPFFEKYKRWIYRESSYFSKFLENHGVDLTLDLEEYNELVNLINSLIDSIVQDKIEQPENLFNNTKYWYIQLLSSSIAYCPNFNLFNLEEKNLEEYINEAVYNKIKLMFLEDLNNENFKNLYYKIRINELDPIRFYPEEYIIGLIDNEIRDLNNKNNEQLDSKEIAKR